MFFKNNFLGILTIVFAVHSSHAFANIELLNIPAIKSKLVTTSIVTALDNSHSKITAVGERGHIFDWQSQGQWQQHTVPVSVLLTDIITLENQSQIAIGQDAAVLSKQPRELQWAKVFDGYQLTELKIALLEKQIVQLESAMAATEDEDELEEYEYQLDELTFSLEDAEVEQKSGPNKPLLSATQSDNGSVFIVGAYGTLLRSDDMGNSWYLQDDILDNPDKLHLNAIENINGHLYIVGESGLAFVSQDNGDSWTQMDLPYSGSIFGIAGQVDSNNLVAFGLQGHAMTSSDAGQSWRAHALGTSASLLGGMATDNGDVFLVGHGGIVVHLNFSNVDNIDIQKHPSGSAFSAVTLNTESVDGAENSTAKNLILAGQFGLIAWQFP